MEPLNKVEMRGRVGSHTITLRKDGHWEGWFDLHVATKDIHGIPQALCFDCHVAEDGKKVKDLGAGIGGKIVQLRGRLISIPETDHNEYYIHVTHLTVVGGPMDKLEIPDPKKVAEESRLKKGVLF